MENDRPAKYGNINESFIKGGAFLSIGVSLKSPTKTEGSMSGRSFSLSPLSLSMYSSIPAMALPSSTASRANSASSFGRAAFTQGSI